MPKEKPRGRSAAPARGGARAAPRRHGLTVGKCEGMPSIVPYPAAYPVPATHLQFLSPPLLPLSRLRPTHAGTSNARSSAGLLPNSCTSRRIRSATSSWSSAPYSPRGPPRALRRHRTGGARCGAPRHPVGDSRTVSPGSRSRSRDEVASEDPEEGLRLGHFAYVAVRAEDQRQRMPGEAKGERRCPRRAPARRTAWRGTRSPTLGRDPARPPPPAHGPPRPPPPSRRRGGAG